MNRVFKISYNIVKSFYLLLFRKQTKKLTSHQKLKRFTSSREKTYGRGSNTIVCTESTSITMNFTYFITLSFEYDCINNINNTC